MREFTVNLKGRVKNFSLPENKSLFPLFEAVVNSLQAIEERQKAEDFNGEISIKIDREETVSEDILGRIENVTIIDNGIGFNDDNFDSFLSSDSDYKTDLGGKGVGRFSWLKAFSKVEINSCFLKEGKYYHRSFDFALDKESISDDINVCENKNPSTSVKLCHFLDKYRINSPIGLDVIAIKIIQHCFLYFLNKKCPQIVLSDNKGNIENLNEIFRNKVTLEKSEDKFFIENHQFNLMKMRVNGAIINSHKIYVCANNRLVETKDLSKLIINLDKALVGESQFWFLGIVTSEYLDENVDMNRLSFTIPETADDGFVRIVTMSKIISQVVELIEAELTEFLKPIADKKRIRIENYISNQAPQYRHILKYMSTELEKIKPGVSDEKLDSILYQLDREFELETKKQEHELVEQIKNDITKLEEYKQKFEEHVARISDENKSILAKYVAHRKSIIDLFEIGMMKQSNERYVKEEFMHNIIYPMRTTSDDIGYEQHNLWLIDERLAYFFFASSDIPFNNNTKEDRPDLMLLDKSIALLETKNEGKAYDKVVIFELKKPMRGDLTHNNPIDQIINYMEKIQTNTITDRNGRLIRTDEHTQFYLYVVCDALENFRNVLKNRYGFNETIDKLGMFRMYNNQYIEVLTYDKIINDAKKRNKILFDKLGI